MKPLQPIPQHVWQQVQRRVRQPRSSRTAILEGYRAIQEALTYAPISPDIVIVKRDLGKQIVWRQLRMALRRHRSTLIYGCTAEQMMQISTVETPPGVMALWKLLPAASWPPPAEGYYVYLYGIRDPGNLGTIFRAALGAGLQGIILSPGSVTPYNPKAARASMSACLRLPFWLDIQPARLIRWYQQAGMPLIVIHAAKPHRVWDMRWPSRGVLIFGGETVGLPDELKSLPGASIPMLAPMDSLNLAVAAAVVFYERLHSTAH